MGFQQPKLPYALGGLVPFMSEEQMSYHYGKHHAGYLKKLNTMVSGTPQGGLSLRKLVGTAEGDLFNNAAQAWNHNFFWNCMSLSGGGEPSGELREAIERDFRSVLAFEDIFTKAAVTLFGSGWVWLAADRKGKLEVMQMPNAGTPLKHRKKPVLALDVWEHAYYLDYKNDRPRYVDGFWNVVNWEFAAENYDMPI